MRKIVSSVMLALILISMLTVAFNVKLAKAITIIVPDDYSTLQQAINAANPGDIIYVRAGIYYENVIVNKSLTLMGENSRNTIIDGSLKDDVVRIIANNVKITGFTIQRSAYTYLGAGIKLNHVSYCEIKGNNVINNYEGIIILDSNNNDIYGNNITENYGAISLGLLFGPGPADNNIYGNNVTANTYGICVGRAGKSNIYGNVITNNTYYGIWIPYSSNCYIYGNNLTNNGYDSLYTLLTIAIFLETM